MAVQWFVSDDYTATPGERCVKVSVGGVEVPIDYAGAQGTYVGLDQVNVRLPKSLMGRGEVEVELSVDGKVANPVRIRIQ